MTISELFVSVFLNARIIDTQISLRLSREGILRQFILIIVNASHEHTLFLTLADTDATSYYSYYRCGILRSIIC